MVIIIVWYYMLVISSVIQFRLNSEIELEHSKSTVGYVLLEQFNVGIDLQVKQHIRTWSFISSFGNCWSSS